MAYFYVDPEVAGSSMGDNTIADVSVHPPIVTKLDYRFDGWLGDALLESFPVFIVTESAKQALVAADLSGASFEAMEFSTSEEFNEFAEVFPGVILPPFCWLKPEGKPGQDDFGIGSGYRLVVSSRVLDILTPMGLAHADIEPFDG